MSADTKLGTLRYEETPVYTTSNGCPIMDPEASQRLGQNGPLLLQDFHLIDLLAHFDRERIPERVVHAKGAGAYGEFEVTHDISDLVRDEYAIAMVLEMLMANRPRWICSVSSARKRNASLASPPWAAKRGRPTRPGIHEGSLSSFTPMRAIGTGSSTIPRSSSSATPPNSPFSYIHKSVTPRRTSKMPPCSGTICRPIKSRLIRSCTYSPIGAPHTRIAT